MRQIFRGAGMDAMPAITGVAEIVLNVRDLPKMRDFYQEVLGFKLLSEACHETGPEPDADGEPTITFLTIKGVDTPLGRHGHPQLLALIDFQRHVFAKETFDGHEPTRSTLNHLAFEIPPESYEAHKERLEAFGLHPRPVTFPAMTARALFFNDPEQNVLELICHAARKRNRRLRRNP
jgi:catechol-2,3-dioxygenase